MHVRASTDRSAGRGRARRVLHVSQATETGVPFVVDDYVHAQLAAGWEVGVACPGGTLGTLMEAAGVEVLDWQATRQPAPHRLPRELAALRSAVQDYRPDVVHLHSAKAGLVGRMLLRGRLPTVYTPHAWSWLAVEGAQHQLAQRWERLATRWSVVCCVSESERDDGHRAGLRGDLRVIPNDIDVPALRAAAPADREAARARLGVADDAVLVVCCARMAPQKGHDTLLEAWRGVAASRADAELALVGDGPDEVAVRERARGVSGVRLLGALPREETLAWMTAADVVVCPSRYEGMSLVPLEAGALGRMVVATDFQGIREGDWGPSRVVVPVGDAAALSSALVDVLSDPEGRRQAEKVARTYADEIAEQPRGRTRLLHLYDELLHHG